MVLSEGSLKFRVPQRASSSLLSSYSASTLTSTYCLWTVIVLCRHRHHASQYYDAFENDCSPGMIEVERKVSGGLESVTLISLPPRAAQGGDRGQCEQPATSAAERQGDIAQEGNWDGLEYNNQPELDLFEPVTTRPDSRSAFSYAATSHGVHG